MLGFSVLILIASALAGVYLIEGMSTRETMIGSAFGILLTALAVYLKDVPTILALLLSGHSGFWSGVVARAPADFSPLVALSLFFIVFPARWIVARDHAIVLKVCSGWLIAVALITAALPLVTTAGYEPDHME
jgi:hypothetical protein